MRVRRRSVALPPIRAAASPSCGVPCRDPNPIRYYQSKDFSPRVQHTFRQVPTWARIVLLGLFVSLAGDACHVASGTTRYLWDGVPTIWKSAIWFPPLVAAGVLALSDMGRRITPRMPAALERTSRDVLPAAAAVLALYALT